MPLQVASPLCPKGTRLKLPCGVVLLGLVMPAFAQFSGPAILSRGEAPGGISSGEGNEFRFALTLTSDVTNGVWGVPTVSSQGQPANQWSLGGGAVVAVTAGHSWNRTHLGIHYNGNFKDYSHSTFNSGLSQGLSIDLTRQLSPRTEITLRESAGMFSRFTPETASVNSSVPFDSSGMAVPTASFLNNRTQYSTTGAFLTFQESARLSFNLGGTYFVNSWSSSGLLGASGAMAIGDMQYRLSSRTTIGLNYAFFRYAYTQGMGGADVHAVAFVLAHRLSQHTEVAFLAGPSRMESNFKQAVAIDPGILAVLCPSSAGVSCPVTTGNVIFHNVEWGPYFSARVSRSFHRGVAFVDAGESILPGNGLFLTSKALRASAGYGYSGLGAWNMHVTATYTSAQSFGNVIGHYGQLAGTYSLSRQIAGPFSFVTTLNVMQYRSAAYSAYNRLIYLASMGVGFASGNRTVPVY